MTNEEQRLSDLQAMSEAINGKPAAYDALLDRHLSRVLALSLAYANDSEPAVREAAKQGLARAVTFDGEKTFVSWLLDHALQTYRQSQGLRPEANVDSKNAQLGHDTIYNDLAGYVLDDVSEATKRMIDKHVRDCSSCAAELERVRAVRRA